MLRRISLLLGIAAFHANSQCKDAAPYPTISQVAEVAFFTGGLANDGRALSIDQEENAEANTRVAANLLSYRPITRPYKKLRSLRINLTRPLPGTASLGVVDDHQAEFHAHYKLDPQDSTGLRLIHSVSEIQPGQAVLSESVRIFFRSGKTPYVLLFGDWAWNTCAPSNGAPIAGGPLTTPATITGLGDRAWRVTSAALSVGRLFRISDVFQPVDRGLFYFDFDVVFRPKP